jgi:hypothetical protein
MIPCQQIISPDSSLICRLAYLKEQTLSQLTFFSEYLKRWRIDHFSGIKPTNDNR